MGRTIRFPVFSAAVLAAVLSACNSGDAADTLSKGVASKLILGYALRQCDETVIYSSNLADPMAAWFRAQAASGFLRPAGREAQAGGNTMDMYSYQDELFQGRVGLSVNAFNRVVTVSMCTWVPSPRTGVAILDTTIDPSGKQARIIFNYPYHRLSKIAQRLTSEVGPPYSPFEANVASWVNGDHTAFLRRLDATGWRVEGIR